MIRVVCRELIVGRVCRSVQEIGYELSMVMTYLEPKTELFQCHPDDLHVSTETRSEDVVLDVKSLTIE
jgi:hypothetical protein